MLRIVIIGAGPAGITAAQTFANKLKASDNVEVIVLEKQKYQYNVIGAPRAYADETYDKYMFIPYDNAIPQYAGQFAKLVRAVATKITTNAISFQRINDNDERDHETETLMFDYLIIATGSTYTVPIREDPSNCSRGDTEARLKEVRGHITKANKILVVGGGSVGCEVAGEIASHYPEKQVTILEGRDRLVSANNLTDKFFENLDTALKQLKINVILGERLEERLIANCFEKRTLRTNKGTIIESDIQLLCGGFSPVSDLVMAMDASLVDDNGAVKVNDRLQVDNDKYHHIFVLGDASNHQTPKLAYWAKAQAKHVAGELVRVVRKSQTHIIKPFPLVTVEAMVLTLGPHGGVSQLPVFGGLVVGDFITRLIKAKDMLAGLLWSQLGSPVPH